jgi:hypothetical protein
VVYGTREAAAQITSRGTKLKRRPTSRAAKAVGPEQLNGFCSRSVQRTKAKRKGGQPKVVTEKKVAMARVLYADKHKTIKEFCHTLKISKTSLYRYFKEK